MKKFLTSSLLLFSLFGTQAFAEEESSAEALLHQMNDASQQLNYELSYILIKKNSIEPLLYRHAKSDTQQLAHLVYLSGPVREVIRRGNEVSYIEPGVDPFTIESGKMVAPLMPLLNSDVKQLSEYYDYVRVGRAREAGAPTQVFRVVPKDGLRYSYVLWVDEKSKLPLRADLLDRDGEILEQYRVISYAVNDHIATMLSSLDDVQLPAVLSLPKGNIEQTFWHVGWVPNGFQPKDLNRYRMLATEDVVESQMFTDGLFSFSVYISDRDSNSLKGQLIRQGRRTVHSIVLNDKQISVVGDIPPATAQRIAQSVTLNKVNKADEGITP
ncbi:MULTISPECIES: sigma-E factor regulatory protein RseB [Vibrio]|jgi:sigma-E factor negative regulatory protein RseB|uniref:Sigma-E factor regulatory protein RseB n=1 Tax=Vibrio mediterranei TaxID=689 RepID=A0AAJ3UTK8_9VIBR|nr:MULTISPECIES: sigma-E factor regulatory protein RseB [Vibrio]ASI89833.1 sigma-E factor regulatory protein RseB [Vibrio mediterranei]EDL51100.1 periplasmic negative regulator of sigmaE [Vibrio mediterranei AK1]KFA96203.1 sigma-E factor regulatory protein RseB [Vibrio sp. ER1A]MCF4171995.1 sigma-E factor regulatory protein RseB [Vibrio sp. McD22-P3]MCG9624489.1 sigma-E factor regulatory protein RseB [Vibrio mediterranei]